MGSRTENGYVSDGCGGRAVVTTSLRQHEDLHEYVNGFTSHLVLFQHYTRPFPILHKRSDIGWLYNANLKQKRHLQIGLLAEA